MRRLTSAGASTKRHWHSVSSKTRVLFPPQQFQPQIRWHNKGRRTVSYLTVNGRVEIERILYWNRDAGSVVPVDLWLGIAQSRHSPGVREMCCREAAGSGFRQAAEDLKRVGQISLTHEMVRQVVEAEAHEAFGMQQAGTLGPAWTAADCRGGPQEPTCVITGADGVKVPLVTEAEKAKRRALRRRRGPRARRRRRRMGRGSDQAYKEFKIVAFYDPHKEHQHVVGTSGDHRVLGRLMRREARRIRLDEAQVKYSVSDGAEWILRQYQQQLPMLDANVLDYYHVREHVIAASYRLFGEASPASQAWREEMMSLLMEQGPVRLLEELGQLRKRMRSSGKRKALEGLQGYIAPRVAMLDYRRFRALGYDIGSGPTEAHCKTLTARLKGPGMRWDRPNAEGMMALAAIRASGLWARYWHLRRQAAA
jgi:hypothetical protein